MSISIRDARNLAQDRAWIQRQYAEYLEDLSRLSLNTCTFPALGEFAEREPELMAHWFADDSSHPLIILQNDKPVGFALVRRRPRNQREPVDFRMADFYITAAARRLGVGREAACLIFRRFSGCWEVNELQHNKPAVNFWRSVVMDFTGGNYRERVSGGEVRQTFQSPAREQRR